MSIYYYDTGLEV